MSSNKNCCRLLGVKNLQLYLEYRTTPDLYTSLTDWQLPDFLNTSFRSNHIESILTSATKWRHERWGDKTKLKRSHPSILTQPRRSHETDRSVATSNVARSIWWLRHNFNRTTITGWRPQVFHCCCCFSLSSALQVSRHKRRQNDVTAAK